MKTATRRSLRVCKEDVGASGCLQLVSAAAHVRIPIAAKPSFPSHHSLAAASQFSALQSPILVGQKAALFYNTEHIRRYTESSVKLRDLIGQRACCSFTLTAVIYPRGTVSGIS